MKNNKLNEGLESLNRIKLLMSYRNDMTLTENEENLNNKLLVEQPYGSTPTTSTGSRVGKVTYGPTWTSTPTSTAAAPTSTATAPTSTAAAPTQPKAPNKLSNAYNKLPKKGKLAVVGTAIGLVATAIGKLSQFFESEPTTEFELLKNFYNVGEALYKSKNDKSSLEFFAARDISLDKSPNFDINAAINTYNSAYDYNIAGLPLGENEEAMRDSILECQTVVDFYLFCIPIGGITKLIEQLKKVPNEYIKQIVNSHLNDDYKKTEEVVTEYDGIIAAERTAAERAAAERAAAAERTAAERAAAAERTAADDAKKTSFLEYVEKTYGSNWPVLKNEISIEGDLFTVTKGTKQFIFKFDGTTFKQEPHEPKK